MPAKAPLTNPQRPEDVDPVTTDQQVDIDDALIDETARVDPDEDLKERAKALTAGRGVDVVFDCIGGDYAEAAVRAIAWEGRLLVIGFTAGITRLPLNLTLLKGCQIVGVFYGAMVQRDPALREAIQRELDALAAAGKLHPHVSARYPLAEAGRALRALLDRKVVGKVVVEPQR